MFRFMFLLVFVLYTAIALAPLEFYQIPITNSMVYWLPVILVSSFIVGCAVCSFLVRPRVRDLESVSTINERTKRVTTLPTLALVVIFAGCIGYANKSGLVVSDFDARFGNSVAISLVEYLLLFFTLVAFCSRYIRVYRMSLPLAATIVIFVGGAFTLGYRSPVVIFFASMALSTLLIYRAREGRLPWLRIVPMAMVAVIFIGALGAFAQYRTETKYSSAKYYRGYNTYALPAIAQPFMDPLTMVRADQQTVSKLITITEDAGYWNGGLFAANFITLLPGEQPGVRNIIGGLTTTHVTLQGKDWSITPTLQGALYLDGGIAGVVIGGGLLGIILTLMDRLTRRRPTAVVFATTTFVTVNLFLLVHTGYPDPIFYLVMIGFGLVYWFALLVTPSKARPISRPWLDKSVSEAEPQGAAE